MHKVAIPDEVYAILQYHANKQERTTQRHIVFILRAWADANVIPVKTASAPPAPQATKFRLARGGVSSLDGTE